MGTPPARAASFDINGSLKLNAISSSIPDTGETHIRFVDAGYRDHGSLSLLNNGSDSLIFERASPSDSALVIDDILLHLQGQKGTVIFRGLALKLKAGGALFDSNQSGNHNLRFDSCTVLGDTVTKGKVIAWGGDGAAALTIRNSQFAYMGSISLTGASSIVVSNSMFAATGPITLSSIAGSSTISLTHNLFNGTGVVSATVDTSLEMRYNTANRVQFLLDGNFSATCDIRNNYFAYPPAANALPQGGSKRYATFFKGGSFISADTSVSENVRDSSWDGFDYFPSGGATLFSHPTNALTHTSKDPGAVWDWKIPGDNSHGAWNGTAPLPDFNLYPPAVSISLPMGSGQAVFQFLPSAFPRLIHPALGTTTYASAPLDSVRPWFRKDTTLVLTGSPATLVGLKLPANKDQGVPVIFIRTDGGFVRRDWNQAGDGSISSPVSQAREFIPALGGQDIYRGTDVILNGPAPANPLILFPSVTRAGKATFMAPNEAPKEKRIRPIRSGLDSVAFEFITDAEGSDSIRFGVPQTGLSAPFLPDSLFFWVGRNAFVHAKESAGMYWGKAAFDSNVLVMLVERLSLAPGTDSIALGRGAKVLATTLKGHQVITDSSYRPSREDFPDMGAFGAAYAFSWPGRNTGDEFFVILPRSDPRQNAYVRNGSKADSLKPADSNATAFKIAFSIGDTGKAVFLARKFMVPAGKTTSLFLAPDSIKDLLSSTPGDIALDPKYRPTGLDTGRYHILAKRGIAMDSLTPQGSFVLLLSAPAPAQRDSLHAFILKANAWTPTTVSDSGGRYAVRVDSAVKAVVLAEGLTIKEQTPTQPAQAAAARVEGDTLTIKPNLDASEKAMFNSYRIELASLDPEGKARMVPSDSASVDASLKVGLADDRLYAYRVIYQTRAGRLSPDMTWIPLAEKQPAAESLQAAIPVRAALRQHLIGFPFDATLSGNVEKSMAGGAAEKESLRRLKPDGTWEKLPVDGKAGLNRKEGYLFAAGKEFRLQVGPSEYRGLAPDTLAFAEKGWHLFSNPFPMRIPRSSMRFDSASYPQTIVRDSSSPGGKGAIYSWHVVDEIRPFEGFLIYAHGPSKIVIDPMAALQAVPKPAAFSATPGSSEIRVALATPWGSDTSVLYRSGPYWPTPYMPPWSETGEEVPRFRVGGEGGWSYRQVDRLDSLATEIEIAAPEKGIYPLTVSPSGAETGPVRLVDWQTGAILDEAGMRSLPLAKGVSRFTLLRGKAVGPGIDAFVRMLPSDFVLDQNYPNPFLGSTRIRFGIPAGAGRVLAGRIRVLAMDGRVLEDRSLGAMTVGSHFLSLGSDAWRPGIYLYELSFRTEQRAFSLRKKMVYGAVAR